MKKLFAAVAFGLVLGVSQAATSATFVDVPEHHWAADAIQRLGDAGLVEGYKDGTYKGDRPMTRYEYAMVVDRLVQMLNKVYCTQEECKVVPPAVPTAPGITPAVPGAAGVSIDPKEFEEMKTIVKKLAAEFRDELAALKVKVDENSSRITKLEDDVKNSRISNIKVSGSIRQRVDMLDSDATDAAAANQIEHMYGYAKNPLNALKFDTGYEMYASLAFTGKAGDNVDFYLGLDKSIRTSPMGYDSGNDENGELVINGAYADLDFTQSVKELDVFKFRMGYQGGSYGPYGLTSDLAGITSIPALKVDIAKDILTLSAIAGASNIDGDCDTFADGTQQCPIGMGSSDKDLYAAGRAGLDLSFAQVGYNTLISGIGEEKAWGADITIPLLTKSPFLKEARAEYLNVTDRDTNAAIAANLKSESFIVGLDVYKTEKSGLTVSYADLPAAVSLSSLDTNPFTESDSTCGLGLDVSPTNCYSFDNDKTLFPAGFEGVAVQARYTVLGDVELGAKALLGNYAGGTLDGQNYTGYGALSVAKPINDKSKVRFEYMQQGKDPILLNRVRGELLINF